MLEGYVTVDEAARRLDRSIEQVRRYLREGTLAGRRIGQQWFIEEAELATWRPARRRPGTGRIGEAVATYEARTMETKEAKTPKPLIDPELLKEVDETAERIRSYAGEIDVVELIRQDREEH
jgi:excisionase family DNA binding protein